METLRQTITEAQNLDRASDHYEGTLEHGLAGISIIFSASVDITDQERLNRSSVTLRRQISPINSRWWRSDQRNVWMKWAPNGCDDWENQATEKSLPDRSPVNIQHFHRPLAHIDFEEADNVETKLDYRVRFLGENSRPSTHESSSGSQWRPRYLLHKSSGIYRESGRATGPIGRLREKEQRLTLAISSGSKCYTALYYVYSCCLKHYKR